MRHTWYQPDIASGGPLWISVFCLSDEATLLC